jgi:hypothetical protein
MKNSLTLDGRMYVQSVLKALKYIFFVLNAVFVFYLCRVCFSGSIFRLQIIFALCLIFILKPQRPIQEGGLVRQIADQRFFIRYQNTEFFLFCLSSFFIVLFFMSKLLFSIK